MKHGLKHVVIASSSSVYGNDSQIPLKEDYVCAKPLAPYAASKRSCELFSHSFYKCHNLPITCLRFFSVYGPNGRHDMMPFKVIDYIVNSKPIRLFGNGELKRDWTFIEDIVDGIILSLGKPLDFEIFNLGFGVSTSMNDFVRIIEDLSGRKAIIEMAESHGMPEMKKIKVIPEKEGMKILHLEIEGVFCGSCGPAIQYDVKSILGVKEVSQEGSKMIVKYDSDVTSKDVIVASIHDPYSAKIISEEKVNE